VSVFVFLLSRNVQTLIEMKRTVMDEQHPKIFDKLIDCLWATTTAMMLTVQLIHTARLKRDATRTKQYKASVVTCCKLVGDLGQSVAKVRVFVWVRRQTVCGVEVSMFSITAE
jgi:hypothetical protein